MKLYSIMKNRYRITLYYEFKSIKSKEQEFKQIKSKEQKIWKEFNEQKERKEQMK